MTQAIGPTQQTYALPLTIGAAVPWRYLAASDHVGAFLNATGTVIANATHGTNFTVLPEGDTAANAGTLAILTAAPTGATQFRLERRTPPVQLYEPTPGAEGVATALDRLTLQAQEDRNRLASTLRVVGATPDPIVLTPGQVPMWNGSSFAPGPTADEVAQAQDNAEAATAAATETRTAGAFMRMTLPLLLADNVFALTAAPGKTLVIPGETRITVPGLGAYLVVDTGETHTTTGSIKLRIVNEGKVTARQFGFDTTGATDVTGQLSAALTWGIQNAVPLDFDGCTFLISGQVGPALVPSGRLHFTPGKWRINVAVGAAPALHAISTEITAAADFVNEAEITIDCNNRFAGGIWFRHYGDGGLARNTGFIRVLNAKQNNAAAVGSHGGVIFFGAFDFIDFGRGEVIGVNRVVNATAADSMGLGFSGAKEVANLEGWRFENIGANSQLPLIVVTGITQANPAVVTAAGHGLVTGAKVLFSAANSGGSTMTQIHSATPYTVTVINANSFSLNGVNSSAFTAFSGTGSCIHELYDFDCIKAIGEVEGGNILNTRTAQPSVRNCKFIDFTGRAVKLQTPGRVDDSFFQINGIPVMRNFTAIDGQIASVRGRGNRFEFRAVGAVNPFLTGLSASVFAAQMQEIDNEMVSGLTDTIILAGAAIPRLCAVVASAAMLDGSVMLDGITGLREEGYAGNLFSRAIAEAEAALIQSSASNVTITVKDAVGPFGVVAIGYTGYVSGAIPGLTLCVQNCRDTTAVNARPIQQLSGAQITDMTRFRLWELEGYNLLYGAVNFDIAALPPCTEFGVIFGSGTITNGPAWTGTVNSTYAMVRSKPEYLGAGTSTVEFEVHHASTVPVTYYRYAGGSTWTEDRKIERQPAPSSTMPTSPTGGATVDAEARAAIIALIAVATENRADMTAAKVTA